MEAASSLFNKLSVKTPTHPTQQQQQSIKVFLRIKPIAPTQKQAITLLADNTILFMHSRINQDAQQVTEGDKFKFDTVLPASTAQEDVFQKSALPLVQSLFDGTSSLVFAYGVTNAGKTYTMLGKQEVSKKKNAAIATTDGIVPRALDAIFKLVEARKQKGDTTDYHVDVSFLEIYNDKVYDLFNIVDEEKLSKAEQIAMNKQTLKISEEGGKNIVKGLRKLDIENFAQGMQFLYDGNKNRQVGETSLNRDSSRSHALFTIRLLSGDLMSDDEDYKEIASLAFVDLAGAERASKTLVAGDRLKEASSINSSLSVLGKCIEIMRNNQKNNKNQQVVPFRESKLTRLIQDTMSNGLVTMIVNVSPAAEECDETLHVLRYGSTAKEVQTGSKIETWRSPAHTTRVSAVSQRLLGLNNSNTTTTTVPAPSYAKNTTSFILSTSQKNEYENQITELRNKMEKEKMEVAYKTREEGTIALRQLAAQMESAYHKRIDQEYRNFETKYEKKLFEVKSLVEQYKQTIHNHQRALQDAQMATEKLSNEQIEERRVKQEEERDRMQSEYENLKKDEIAILHKEHNAELERIHTEFSSEMDKLKGQVQNARQEASQVSESVEDWKNKYAALEMEYDALEHEIDASKDDCHSQFKSEKTKAEELEKIKNSLTTEITYLKKEHLETVTEKDRQLEDLHRRLNSQQDDYFSLLAKYEELKSKDQQQPNTPIKRKSMSLSSSIINSIKGLTSPLSMRKGSAVAEEKQAPKRGKKRKSEEISPDDPALDLRQSLDAAADEEVKTFKKRKIEKKDTAPAAMEEVEDDAKKENNTATSKTITRSRKKKLNKQQPLDDKMDMEEEKENSSKQKPVSFSRLSSLFSPKKKEAVAAVVVDSPEKKVTRKRQATGARKRVV